MSRDSAARNTDKNMKKIITLSLTCLLLASCGTGKHVTNPGTTQTSTTTKNQGADAVAKQKLTFVQKVYDNAAYQQNLVSKISFTLVSGSKDITVPGSLHMRKDDVIRLQLFVPLIGSEVGRLEFTKDYVLIMDRIHKQYVKADYNQVDFLNRNGINFASLQALFWNQLFIPGAQKVGEMQLKAYDVDLAATGTSYPISLTQKNMSFVWNADKTSGQINSADITYNSKEHGNSSLNWKYSDFRSFGSKKFPYLETFDISTNATGKNKKVQVSIELNKITTDSDWETRTNVSSKYQQVDVESLLKQLMNL